MAVSAASTTHVGDAGGVVAADRCGRGRSDLERAGRCASAARLPARRPRRASRRTAAGSRSALSCADRRSERPGRRRRSRSPSRRRGCRSASGATRSSRSRRVGDHLGAADRVVALAAPVGGSRSRRCRRARRRGCPSGRWRRSARSGRWRPAPPAAGRRAWRSRGRRSSVPIVKSRRLGQQVADLAQEGGLLGHVQRLAAALAPAGVDLRLQLVAPAPAARDCRGVKSAQDGLQRRPRSAAGSMSGPGQQLTLDEGVQEVVDRRDGGC